MNGDVLQAMRGRMGEILARESPAVGADLVIPVPDSGAPAARGFARASGLPQDDGLIKNRYVGRTFIEPGQELRKHGLRLKFNPLPEIVGGKSIVVVDDSIVRGNTTRHLVQMLREAGAREVHLRISAPPIKHPCHYGVDMSTREEMIAHGRTVDEIAAELHCDSLAYSRWRACTRPCAGRPIAIATRASAAATRSRAPTTPTASSRSSCRSCGRSAASRREPPCPCPRPEDPNAVTLRRARRLRRAVEADEAALGAILSEPEVVRWWGPFDPDTAFDELESSFVIVVDGEVAGWLLFEDEDWWQYRHVAFDIALGTALQGSGYGQEALRLAIRWFILRGHHRFTLDPAADNERAIRTYARSASSRWVCCGRTSSAKGRGTTGC